MSNVIVHSPPRKTRFPDVAPCGTTTVNGAPRKVWGATFVVPLGGQPRKSLRDGPDKTGRLYGDPTAALWGL